MIIFGPTFEIELEAAGLLTLPITWGSDGDIQGRENLTTEQDDALQAVIDAHDPTATVHVEAELEMVERVLMNDPIKRREIKAEAKRRGVSARSIVDKILSET